jgi:hypothetical protein
MDTAIFMSKHEHCTQTLIYNQVRHQDGAPQPPQRAGTRTGHRSHHDGPPGHPRRGRTARDLRRGPPYRVRVSRLGAPPASRGPPPERTIVGDLRRGPRRLAAHTATGERARFGGGRRFLSPPRRSPSASNRVASLGKEGPRWEQLPGCGGLIAKLFAGLSWSVQF